MTAEYGQPNSQGAQIVQPAQASQAPAGWYVDHSGVMRWWDGQSWTEHTQQSPAAYALPQQVVPAIHQQVVVQNAGPRTIGLSGGAHAVHAVLSVLSLGVWLPVWVIHALLARRTVRY